MGPTVGSVDMRAVLSINSTNNELKALPSSLAVICSIHWPTTWWIFVSVATTANSVCINYALAHQMRRTISQSLSCRKDLIISTKYVNKGLLLYCTHTHTHTHNLSPSVFMRVCLCLYLRMWKTRLERLRYLVKDWEIGTIEKDRKQETTSNR